MVNDDRSNPGLDGLNLAVVVLAILVALFAPVEEIGAQDCWECRPMKYTNPPCWMDSCTWAGGAGYPLCHQFGECDDDETCEGFGGGCEGGGGPPPTRLDGRSIAGLNSSQVRTLLAEARPEVLAGLSWHKEAGREYLKLSCNGAVIHAVYPADEAALLRRRTSRITL